MVAAKHLWFADASQESAAVAAAAGASEFSACGAGSYGTVTMARVRRILGPIY